ncbi:hypothetical protein [Nocardia sp. NBC_01009]|uniref:hypothetical protein n=1 Tax=Nocardia sp. NBC_01009 TaxID=2975996 RepID=UPI00386A2AFF|nr:hypothetical protein OHA42_18250 [Nocardia sp. NBC_01009]
MKGGTRVAIGVGIGYLLGRTHKMRFALMMAGAAMSRRSSGVPAELLKQGTSLLKSSPQLTQLTDTVRGELLDAVRSAAVTAASNRIDAFNARLEQGSTLLADKEDRDESRETDSDEDESDEQPTRGDEQASADEDEDLEDEEDSEQGHDEDDEADEEDTRRPAARTRARRSGTTSGRKTGSRGSVRRSASGDRKPTSSVRRRSRSDTDEAPVRRTRR